MPEKQGYMTELDQWSWEAVIEPIIRAYQAYGDAPDEVSDEDRTAAMDSAVSSVQKAIRDKVLESYRNGQKAGPKREEPRRKGYGGR